MLRKPTLAAVVLGVLALTGSSALAGSAMNTTAATQTYYVKPSEVAASIASRPMSYMGQTYAFTASKCVGTDFPHGDTRTGLTFSQLLCEAKDNTLGKDWSIDVQARTYGSDVSTWKDATSFSVMGGYVELGGCLTRMSIPCTIPTSESQPNYTSGASVAGYLRHKVFVFKTAPLSLTGINCVGLGDHQGNAVVGLTYSQFACKAMDQSRKYWLVNVQSRSTGHRSMQDYVDASIYRITPGCTAAMSPVCR
jgi:hypothetical protein